MIVYNREQYEGAPAPRGFTVNHDDHWDTPDDGDYLRRLALGFEQKGDLRRARAYHRAADVIDPPSDAEPDAALVEARFALETAQSNLACVAYLTPYHGPSDDALKRAQAEISRAMTALPGGEN